MTRRLGPFTEGLANVLLVKSVTCFVGELVSMPDKEPDDEPS